MRHYFLLLLLAVSCGLYAAEPVVTVAPLETAAPAPEGPLTPNQIPPLLMAQTPPSTSENNTDVQAQEGRLAQDNNNVTEVTDNAIPPGQEEPQQMAQASTDPASPSNPDYDPPSEE